MTVLPLLLFFIALSLLVYTAVSLWDLKKKLLSYEKHIAVIEATLVGVTKKVNLLEVADKVSHEPVVEPASLLSLEAEQDELEQKAELCRNSSEEPQAERALIEKMKKITSS
ncbi:MAG: hypothetical protein Q9O24_09075 [Gammaproteobacteria bacterium]|nr:hypothetical protein [Gammaproteobacteria bacterium]